MTDKIPDHVVMTPVNSSQIKAVGHSPQDSQLYVEFPKKTGRSVYRYENVTADKHAALMGADKEDHSIGRYFGQHIKGDPEFHPFTKLNLEDDNAV